MNEHETCGRQLIDLDDRLRRANAGRRDAEDRASANAAELVEALQEVERLRALKENGDNTIQGVLAEVARLERSAASWQEDCRRATLEVERLGTDLMASRAEVTHWREAWYGADEERERLRAENAHLVDRHNREAHGTKSHEAMEVDRLQGELDQAVMASEFDRAEVARLRQDNAALDASAFEQAGEVERLRAEIRTHAEIVMRAAAAQAEVGRLKAQVRQLEQLLGDFPDPEDLEATT